MNKHIRSNYIGSSDIAAIIGVSKYNTPLDIYNSKITPIEETPNKAMLRGVRFEPIVCGLIEEDRLLKIKHRNKRIYHPEYSFLTAEIDAESECGVQIEIKTSSAFMSKSWGESIEEIPINYLAQLYWAMGLNNKQECLLAVMIDFDVKYYEVKQNIEIFHSMVLKALEFWNTYILTKTPPPAINSDDLLCLFPSASGNKEANLEILNCIEDLKIVKDKAKKLAEDKEILEFKIKNFLEDKEIITLGDEVLATFKTQHKNECFVKASTFKVLRIK